jgi:hypothetical protein
MKPTLKAPGTKLLKLQCQKLVSSFGFNFNLRRYIQAKVAKLRGVVANHPPTSTQGATPVPCSAQLESFCP